MHASATDLHGNDGRCVTTIFFTTDTVVVKDSGTEVLTKQSKEWKDVCYNLNLNGNEDAGSDDDDDDQEDGVKKEPDEGDDRPGAVKTRRMRDKGKMYVFRVRSS